MRHKIICQLPSQESAEVYSSAVNVYNDEVSYLPQIIKKKMGILKE